MLHKAAAFVSSDAVSVVIRKEVTGDSDDTDGKGPPEIRPASPADVLALVETDTLPDVDANELWERRLRQHILATIGVDGCYVADNAGVQPAFMQYLFTAHDNERLRANFAGLFPVLAADEAMVEFLYVAPEVRNPGFIVKSLLRVTDEARRKGATSVISFIDPSNTGALFVNHLAGFQADLVRRNRSRLLRRTYSFEDWPSGMSRSLSDIASGRVSIS